MDHRCILPSYERIRYFFVRAARAENFMQGHWSPTEIRQIGLRPCIYESTYCGGFYPAMLRRAWLCHSILSVCLSRKATEFKFGRYIHRVHQNKSPLKILEKRERGRMQGLPKCLGYPQLSQEQVKLRTSNFVRIHVFMASIGRKVH